MRAPRIKDRRFPPAHIRGLRQGSSAERNKRCTKSRTDFAGMGARPCDGKPLSRPRQLRLWQLRLRLRDASNRSQRPALCYLKCHCRRIYSGKGDCIWRPRPLRLLRVVPAERVRRLGAALRPGHGFPQRGAELQSLIRSSARLRGCASNAPTGNPVMVRPMTCTPLIAEIKKVGADRGTKVRSGLPA